MSNNNSFKAFIEWNGEANLTFDDLIISSEKEYEQALLALDKVFHAKEGSPASRKFIALVDLIEAYEAIHYPIEKKAPRE